MQAYTRLFDLLTYQKANFYNEVAIAGKVATANGSGKEWKKYSTNDCINMVNKVSKALLEFGIQRGDTVAIIANNRPEWNFVDLGAQQIGAIIVPIYPTISESEYHFVFNHAEVKLCFVSDGVLFNKVQNIKAMTPRLQKTYTFDRVAGATNFEDILTEVTAADLAIIEQRKAEVKAEDVATIIYTSGTTGTPKGVMLSHNNLISNIEATNMVHDLPTGQVALSFLPLCHIFERMVFYTYLSRGFSVYYAESLETIGDNLKEISPQYFTTVPRLLEKVYEKIMAKGYELTGLKSKIFFWAIDVGSQYELATDQGWWYNYKLKWARKLVFSKWQDALGGRIQAIMTGAAAMQPRLATLFTAAGIAVVEGYGLTETSPGLTANRLDESERKLGTVGIPLPNVEIKIAEDGEILAKGPNIMLGYYKRPDLTAEVINAEGWFHTGDVGEFDGPFLKITDRKKELFKTSGGKYVAPQPIENRFKEAALIEQIAVIGNDRKFVSALIVPSFMALENWCEQHNLPCKTPQQMITHPEVLAEFEKVAKAFNKDINKVEQIKKFTLLPTEWSV